MSRRTVGPFKELQDLPHFHTVSDDPVTICERMALVCEVLCEAGCKCNGEACEKICDPEWGCDLSELIARCCPHTILQGGKTITVAIKIDTLRVEIDDNNEVMCWIYEESEVFP